jgi:hypothetical protein
VYEMGKEETVNTYLLTNVFPHKIYQSTLYSTLQRFKSGVREYSKKETSRKAVKIPK